MKTARKKTDDRWLDHICNRFNMASQSRQVAALSKKHEKLLTMIERAEQQLERTTDKELRAKAIPALDRANQELLNLRSQINAELFKKQQ